MDHKSVERFHTAIRRSCSNQTGHENIADDVSMSHVWEINQSPDPRTYDQGNEAFSLSVWDSDRDPFKAYLFCFAEGRQTKPRR
jgi:hypothetical protein